MLDKNKVTLIGRVHTDPVVDHDTTTNTFYTFILDVKRNSGVSDYVPVLIGEEFLNIISNAQDNRVIITGQFQSNRADIDGKRRLLIFVAAFSAEILENDQYPEYVNNVVLESWVTQPPVFRYTPSGRRVCDVMVVVNTTEDRADYFPCICWGDGATAASMLEKGQRLSVTGRIQSRQYTKHHEDGTSEVRTAYELSIQHYKKIEKCA